MNESGKVALATALSMAVHVSLFGLLALMPGASAVPAPEPEPPSDARPLEVTLEVPPEPSAPSAEELATAPLPLAGGIRTQIDPENLKKAERAPEHATAIAAHDSEASQGKAPEPAPAATPASSPDGAPALTVAPAAEAKGTEPGIDALGNYGKAVGNAIGVRSEFYRRTQKNILAVGEVRLQFTLDARGGVSAIKILSNTAGPANAVCAERAVREAHIPPIPPERLAQVPGGRMQIVYTFTIYHP
ncbi:MAG: energy transducer TonB [Chthoniobacteraceae bacterium]|nr:energy transducer TonB [Chthoniobacteraceae bacterium]